MTKPRTKMDSWRVVKGTGGVTFVQFASRGCKRFDFHFDEGEADEVAALLNKQDRLLRDTRAALIRANEKLLPLAEFRAWQREQGPDYGEFAPKDDEAAIRWLINQLPEYNG